MQTLFTFKVRHCTALYFWHVPRSALGGSNVFTTQAFASVFAFKTVHAPQFASSAFPLPTTGLLPPFVIHRTLTALDWMTRTLCPRASTLMCLPHGRNHQLKLAKVCKRRLITSSNTNDFRRKTAFRRTKAFQRVVPQLYYPLLLFVIINFLPPRNSSAVLSFTQQLCTRPLMESGTCSMNDCHLPNALVSTASRLLRIYRLLPKFLRTALLLPNLEKCQRLVSAILTELFPVYALYAISRNITVDRFFEILSNVIWDT